MGSTPYSSYIKIRLRNGEVAQASAHGLPCHFLKYRMTGTIFQERLARNHIARTSVGDSLVTTDAAIKKIETMRARMAPMSHRAESVENHSGSFFVCLILMRFSFCLSQRRIIHYQERKVNVSLSNLNNLFPQTLSKVVLRKVRAEAYAFRRDPRRPELTARAECKMRRAIRRGDIGPYGTHTP